MKKITAAVISILVTFGSLAGPSITVWGLETVSVASAQQSTNSVTIQNFSFSPASITVTPGTTVTWTNKDTTAHTVTADSGTGPNSSQLQPNQTYTFKFDQAGTYAYHCSIHPQMKASVVVAAAASGQGQSPSPTPTPTPTPPSSTTQPSQTTPPPATPQQTIPTGGGGAAGNSNVAAGPVAAGSGSTGGLQHVPALIAGAFAFITAGIILGMRQYRHLRR
jgi:plastocyanin